MYIIFNIVDIVLISYLRNGNLHLVVYSVAKRLDDSNFLHATTF